jgi:hypothetical protein
MTEMRNTHRIMFEKSEEELPFGNSTDGWENIVTTGLK